MFINQKKRKTMLIFQLEKIQQNLFRFSERFSKRRAEEKKGRTREGLGEEQRKKKSHGRERERHSQIQIET